jgi:hypothetical protein
VTDRRYDVGQVGMPRRMIMADRYTEGFAFTVSDEHTFEAKRFNHVTNISHQTA